MIEQGEMRQFQEEEEAGAPEWMLTFSDCMTLLLTFFVLLLSFSSFDERTFRRLRVIFCNAMPGLGEDRRASREAFLSPEGQIKSLVDLEEGSEKPTLRHGKGDNLKEETEPLDFYSRKVFLIPSSSVFWGNSTAISLEGRDIMTTMASFLRELPSRIVISENGSSDEQSRERGLRRAWAVMNYLTEKHGLNKNWFSISAVSTVSSTPTGARQAGDTERMVEIVLLERSIYN